MKKFNELYNQIITEMTEKKSIDFDKDVLPVIKNYQDKLTKFIEKNPDSDNKAECEEFIQTTKWNNRLQTVCLDEIKNARGKINAGVKNFIAEDFAIDKSLLK
jgi:hypothetical protein